MNKIKCPWCERQTRDDLPHCDWCLKNFPEKSSTALCHLKDAGEKTIREIMRWSVQECADAEATDEIQRLGTRLKLLVSGNTERKQDRAQVLLSRWMEWARAHGHLEHAAGIAADTRDILSNDQEHL
jgi:hypothetical protein